MGDSTADARGSVDGRAERGAGAGSSQTDGATRAGACGGASSKGEPGAAAPVRGTDSNRERCGASATSLARATVWAYFPLGNSVIGTDWPVSDCVNRAQLCQPVSLSQ